MRNIGRRFFYRNIYRIVFLTLSLFCSGIIRITFPIEKFEGDSPGFCFNTDSTEMPYFRETENNVSLGAIVWKIYWFRVLLDIEESDDVFELI